MREMKVRAFDKVNNEWLDSDELIYQAGCWFKDYRALEDYEALPVKQGDVEISFFIGLKDKNGREIFLKDIVKREFEIWETKWAGSLENNDLAPYDEFVCAGCFIGVVSRAPQGLYVLNKCKKFDDEGNFIEKRSSVKLFAHRCEVIGNIYENPELLEV